MANRRTKGSDEPKDPKDKRVSVHFRIHPDMARNLRTFAAHHGKRYSTVVREAVENHIRGFYVGQRTAPPIVPFPEPEPEAEAAA